jgi:molecular chaperone DnaK (HSP70)
MTLVFIVKPSGDKPMVEVNIGKGETKIYSPEEISAMILGKMKQIAEAFLGDTYIYITMFIY